MSECFNYYLYRDVFKKSELDKGSDLGLYQSLASDSLFPVDQDKEKQ